MEPETFGGISDFLVLLKPDFSKVNKAFIKEGLSKITEGMKPGTTWPLNLDDVMYDQLNKAIVTYIDNLGVKSPWDGALTVGDGVEGRVTDVPTYLSKFTVVAPEAKRAFKRQPKLLGLMQQEFTAAEQAKIVGNPFLIGLLSIFGPMIIEFIKNWLSRN